MGPNQTLKIYNFTPSTISAGGNPCNCNYFLFTKLPWSGDSEGTFWSSNLAATCLPHTAEASHCPVICWTSSREAVNTNFYSLWFDPTLCASWLPGWWRQVAGWQVEAADIEPQSRGRTLLEQLQHLSADVSFNGVLRLPWLAVSLFLPHNHCCYFPDANPHLLNFRYTAATSEITI